MGQSGKSLLLNTRSIYGNHAQWRQLVRKINRAMALCREPQAGRGNGRKGEDMSEKETSFDMNQCKPGDKILSKHGMILEYLFIDEVQAPYRHRVKYPGGSQGTRLDNGMVYKNSPLPEDHDIVGFAK